MIPYDEKVPLPSHRDGQNKIKKSRYFFGRMNIYIYIYIYYIAYIHTYLQHTHSGSYKKKSKKMCRWWPIRKSNFSLFSFSPFFTLCVCIYHSCYFLSSRNAMLLSAVVVVVDVRSFQQPLIGAFLLLFFSCLISSSCCIMMRRWKEEEEKYDYSKSARQTDNPDNTKRCLI